MTEQEKQIFLKRFDENIYHTFREVEEYVKLLEDKNRE